MAALAADDLERRLDSSRIQRQPKNIGIETSKYIVRRGQCSASIAPANKTLMMEPQRAKPCAQLTPVERIEVG